MITCYHHYSIFYRVLAIREARAACRPEPPERLTCAILGRCAGAPAPSSTGRPRPFVGARYNAVDYAERLITPSSWRASRLRRQPDVCHGTIGEIGIHHGSGPGLLCALADAEAHLWMADLFNQGADIDRSGNGDEAIADTVITVANRKVHTLLCMFSGGSRNVTI